MTLLDAARQALSALENHGGNYKLTNAESDSHNKAVKALTAAIEEAEKAQPAAWVLRQPEGTDTLHFYDKGGRCEPLYVRH